MDQIKNGESPYHFIEVMGCPSGCIMGGGQPRSKDPDVRTKRLEGIYDEDESKVMRKSHENPSVKKLYEEYLEFPNSHVSHELLHTHYIKRGQFNEYLEDEYVNEEVIPMAEKNKAYESVITSYSIHYTKLYEFVHRKLQRSEGSVIKH